MQILQTLVFVFALSLLGCGDFSSFSKPRDPKAESTRGFWTDLQEIEHKQLANVNQRMKEIQGSVEQSDWTRAAELLHELSTIHQAVAEQLRRLDHENVYGEALMFRNQLASIHESIAESSKRYGTEMKDGNSKDMQTWQSQFLKSHEEWVSHWESSAKLVESLEAKFGKGFRFPL